MINASIVIFRYAHGAIELTGWGLLLLFVAAGMARS